MNVTNFLATKVAVALPSSTNPKVYLAIDTADLSKMSFELYNPFSIRGRLFKKFTRFLCVYTNGLAKKILPTVSPKGSQFMTYVSKKLNKDLLSSVYVATAKDKVVLQLVAQEKIVGYLKYPLTSEGKKRLRNEIEGIRVLSKLGLVPNLLYKDNYGKTDFIILPKIEGSIGALDEKELANVLASFKKNKSYLLSGHPRIIDLQKKATVLGMDEVTLKISALVKNSHLKYCEVYEHGDFAPWNIIRTVDGLVPFDFEYFVEKGIEHFDEIKYHFQVAHLLEGKTDKKLLDTVKNRIATTEFPIMFGLFLVKEILIKKEEGMPSTLEERILGYI